MSCGVTFEVWTWVKVSAYRLNKDNICTTSYMVIHKWISSLYPGYEMADIIVTNRLIDGWTDWQTDKVHTYNPFQLRGGGLMSIVVSKQNKTNIFCVRLCQFCVVIRFFIPITMANDPRLRRVSIPDLSITCPIKVLSEINQYFPF